MKEGINPNENICVVLDTNVLVSALLTSNNESPTALIVSFLYKGLLKPLYNERVLSEYEDVLNRKNFNFDPQTVAKLISTIQSIGINVIETVKSDGFFPDPDDIVFYEVKMSVDDSYLVTGNLKHFPRKPFVVTPAEMISILKEKNLF